MAEQNNQAERVTRLKSRQNPSVIEAFQLQDGPGYPKWFEEAVKRNDVLLCYTGTQEDRQLISCSILRLGAVMTAHPGDWIILDLNGKISCASTLPAAVDAEGLPPPTMYVSARLIRSVQELADDGPGCVTFLGRNKPKGVNVAPLYTAEQVQFAIAADRRKQALTQPAPAAGTVEKDAESAARICENRAMHWQQFDTTYAAGKKAGALDCAEAIRTAIEAHNRVGKEQE